jgi:hypothetical protein
LLIAGNSEYVIDKLMEKVGTKFEIKSLGGATHYLGIDIEQDNEGNYMISQPTYIDTIVAEAGQQESRKTSDFPLDPGYSKQQGTEMSSNKQYRKLIGMLLYLSTNSRPDIAAAVAILSKKVEHPRHNDLSEVIRVVRYLKSTRNLKLRLSVQEHNELIVHSDANWAEDVEDRKSNTGYHVTLNGGTISWCCRKQDIVSQSSTEAEYIALAESCKEVLWLRELVKGFDIEITEPQTINTDSQSCIGLLKNQKFSHKSKHFDTRYHFIRDHVNRGTIRLEYVKTTENVADLMTKPLPGPRTEYLRKKAGLENYIESRRSVEL